MNRRKQKNNSWNYLDNKYKKELKKSTYLR